MGESHETLDHLDDQTKALLDSEEEHAAYGQEWHVKKNESQQILSSPFPSHLRPADWWDTAIMHSEIGRPEKVFRDQRANIWLLQRNARKQLILNWCTCNQPGTKITEFVTTVRYLTWGPGLRVGLRFLAHLTYWPLLPNSCPPPSHPFCVRI